MREQIEAEGLKWEIAERDWTPSDEGGGKMGDGIVAARVGDFVAEVRVSKNCRGGKILRAALEEELLLRAYKGATDEARVISLLKSLGWKTGERGLGEGWRAYRPVAPKEDPFDWLGFAPLTKDAPDEDSLWRVMARDYRSKAARLDKKALTKLPPEASLTLVELLG